MFCHVNVSMFRSFNVSSWVVETWHWFLHRAAQSDVHLYNNQHKQVIAKCKVLFLSTSLNCRLDGSARFFLNNFFHFQCSHILLNYSALHCWQSVPLHWKISPTLHCVHYRVHCKMCALCVVRGGWLAHWLHIKITLAPPCALPHTLNTPGWNAQCQH